MNTTITAKKVLTHPYLSIVCALCILFLLPRYGSMAAMIGCATFLSAFVVISPESFRSRRRSMTTAIGLVTAMWLAAAVIAALTLMGEI